ncbi:MAG: AAA family ATPase, partial [Bacteroidales bacterium]|nr:AAA family ATPase [Bacteroidales bacterium]
MFLRKIEDRIASAFELNKVVVLLGARRVGKTTLIKSMMDKLPDSRYINCELLQNRDLLQTTNSEKIFSFIGSYKY